jgi:hypothetical protein
MISPLPAAFKLMISKSCYEEKSQKNLNGIAFLFGPGSRFSNK